MVTKKKGLGRGLDALLTPRGKAGKETDAEGELAALPVEKLQRGQYQPRLHMDEQALTELSESIRAQGLVQPILVRPVGNKGQYEIIAGERRWRAAQMAELHEVPVVIREVPDQAAMCIALIENIQREDLNPIDEAMALSRLIKEFEMTHEAIATAVGRSRSAVSNLLRLLELETEVRQLLEQGQLEMGHARALLALKATAQVDAARQVSNLGLSVRATEALVKKLQSRSSKKQKTVTTKDPNIADLEQQLSERLGAQVSLKHGKNKGTVTIQYHSLDQLQGILDKIKT